MVQAIKYNPEVGVIRGIDVTDGVPIGIDNAVTILEVRPDDVVNVNYLRNNSLAALRLKVTIGNLISIRLRIFFYTGEISTTETFGLVSSDFSGFVENIRINEIQIDVDGSYSYVFPIQPCDGIKIIAFGEGEDNTGSKIELVHLAVRTE